MARKLFIQTHGCQMNEYDSTRMVDLLESSHGLEPTDNPEEADVLLLNTCSIREKAQEKVFHQLGRWKKLKDAKPDMVIAVGGCVASQEGDAIRDRAPYVDVVFGPQTLHRLPGLITQAATTRKLAIDVTFPEVEKFDNLPEPSVDGPSAFVSIMEGCSKYCTFCVVPYTRGEEVSRPVQPVLQEIEHLAEMGVREVNLLGQNVNAFHGAAPAVEGGDDWTLGQLCRHIAKIGGIERIRYTTSHPRDMEDDLIAAHGDTPQMQPFLHLPVQSGSDRILKAMNRSHTADAYREIIRKVRAAQPDIAIASDFIVGFPGESDEDFEATMQLVRDVNYAVAYSFKYSQRPGTPAAEMFGQVPEDVKDVRLQALQKLLRDQQTEFNESKIGQTVPVLVTGRGRLEGQAHGRSPWMQSVHFQGPEELTGQIVDVKVSGATMSSLTGDLVREHEVAL